MKYIRFFGYIALLTILFSFGSRTTKSKVFDPQRMFTVEELQEDFRAMRREMEKKHPNLYLYSTKERMDFVFDSMYAGINQAMSYYEFLYYITPIGAVIKDGHNLIGPSEASGKYADKHQGYFPLHITYIDNKMYSDMNCSRDTSLFDGAEIMSISGKSASAIHDEFVSRMVRDGNNETFPLWIMNNYFRGFYGFLTGFPDLYMITFVGKTGSLDTLSVPALPIDTIVKIKKQKYVDRVKTSEKNQGMSLRFVDGSSTAIIRIQSFDPKTLRKGTHQRYKSEIKKYFASVDSAKCKNLILDVRDNNGGNPMFSKLLLQYILKQPFEMASRTLQTRRINPGNHFSRLVKCRMPGFGKGRFSPVKHPFLGNVFVLINGGSFSATGEFASVFSREKRGVLIGEETGGNKVICGGQMFANKLALPNTRIVCNVGTEASIIGDINDNNGHGTMPDYFMRNTIEDIVGNRDAVMEFTLDLITKN